MVLSNSDLNTGNTLLICIYVQPNGTLPDTSDLEAKKSRVTQLIQSNTAGCNANRASSRLNLMHPQNTMCSMILWLWRALFCGLHANAIGFTQKS